MEGRYAPFSTVLGRHALVTRVSHDEPHRAAMCQKRCLILTSLLKDLVAVSIVPFEDELGAEVLSPAAAQPHEPHEPHAAFAAETPARVSAEAVLLEEVKAWEGRGEGGWTQRIK